VICNTTHRVPNHSTPGYQSIALPTELPITAGNCKISKNYEQIVMDNKILVSILTHRCQCPHVRPKTGGVRGGATQHPQEKTVFRAPC
jgi:hypothetical protein